jgi:hypothetical protein
VPTVTPTLETHPCTVKQDTYIYREPSENSVKQERAEGTTVNVIDTVESDGHTWYRVMLPGQEGIVLYVHVEDVECE